MNGSVGKGVPELIPVRRIHNYIYCPRLMYFQFVENIFIPDAAVIDGETTHRRVEVPPACDFPDEIANSNAEMLRSVALESSELGIVGVIDLLKKNEDGCTWTLYDYKRGSAARDTAGKPCAKEADEVQVQMYILLATPHHFSITRGMVYYAEEKRCVEVVQSRDEKALQALIDAVRRVAAGDLPPPLEADNRCLFCSMNQVCLPEESLYWKKQRKILHPPQKPPFAENSAGEVLIVQNPRAWVSKNGDVFVVSVSGEKVSSHPIHSLQCMFIYGAAQLSIQAVCSCLTEGIQVGFFSPAGKFIGRLDTLAISGLDSRRGQYKITESEEHCIKIARSMIQAKIANQRILLMRNGRNINAAVLGEMANLRKKAVRAMTWEELLGIEGRAAALYFENFPAMITKDVFAQSFRNRNRRPPQDPINAMLSIGYSILSSELTGICAVVGLDPACGLLHTPRFGRPALALDIMEEFRPLIVDSVVLSVVNRGAVEWEDFIFSSQGCSLRKSAHQAFWMAYARRMNEELIHPAFHYRMSYRRLLEVQVRQLWRIFRGDISSYHPIVTR